MDARIVAIDSSTERLVLALQSPQGDFTLDEDGGARASARLLPGLHDLLARAGLALRDLDAIAYARGPGAFTGLRTACAVAQGLALGLGRPALPLDSLLVVAEAARVQGAGNDLWVAMDARMDEVYAARYGHDGTRWHEAEAPALWTLPALAERWRADPPAAVAGSALAAFGARLGLTAATALWPDPHQRGAALLRVARAAWRDGATVDAADALPLYLRDKVALTTAERAAARPAGR